MERQTERNGSRGAGFEDPALTRSFPGDARLAWLWLLPRVALGWLWFEAGQHQLERGVGIGPLGESSISQAMAAGQTLAGIALILGAFVGVAAFAGGVLGSGLLPTTAGAATPLIFIIVMLLVLAWKTAGWVGLDRWLLPLIGMPWRGGELFGERTEHFRMSERKQSWLRSL